MGFDKNPRDFRALSFTYLCPVCTYYVIHASWFFEKKNLLANNKQEMNYIYNSYELYLTPIIGVGKKL